MSTSSAELTKGLAVLQDEWQKVTSKTEWEQVKLLQQYDTTFLQITKRIPRLSNGTQESQDGGEVEEEEEEDSEALQHTSKPAAADGPLIIYDIIYSSSYQVPVLYLTFKNLPSGRPPSIEEIYQMLVPDSHTAAMQAVGEMGALSMTEHPVAGMPAYFVHPCRTREAMEPIVKGKDIKPEKYVVLWLGTIGGSVGLDVPFPLALRLDTPQRDA